MYKFIYYKKCLKNALYSIYYNINRDNNTKMVLKLNKYYVRSKHSVE